MPKPLDGPLTRELLAEDTRFLLKTLLRDDLFGDEVSLTEAEKLMDASLSVGFVDYCAFLKKRDYVTIDRARNTIKVTPKGRLIADGMDDSEFHRELVAHFSARLAAQSQSNTSLPPIGGNRSTLSGVRGPASGASGLPTASMTPAALDDLKDGRYSRLEALGQGGVGQVFRGRNVFLNRDVAIKEFRHVKDYLSFLQRDEVMRRLRSSVMAQASLNHPHVLEVLDLNFEKDPPHVILQLAVGGNLAERVARGRAQKGGVLDAAISTRILLQTAYALHHAHQKGVLHADLRPENILFDHAGNVRVADFGVARSVEKSPGQGPPVYVGVGNPSFLAPEQMHGTGEVTASTDVYSFGILLYYVVTGNLPGRRSPMPSEVNSTCPKALDTLFDQMTHDRPEDRIKDFGAVLDGLYAAFPRDVVLTRGTLLLFTEDPLPPPAPAAPEATVVTGAPDPAPASAAAPN